MRRFAWPLASLAFDMAPLAAQEQAVELGRIGWARDLAALAAGDRPGLLLFQEVPG